MIKTIGLFLFLLLKIFGWILLILLLAAAAALLAVLFVPVHYQAEADNEMGGQKSPLKNLRLHIKASWLVHLIHISVHYGPDGNFSHVRAAGIDLLKIFSRRAKKKAAEKSPGNRGLSAEKKEKSEKTEPAGAAAPKETAETELPADAPETAETPAQQNQAEVLSGPVDAPEAEMPVQQNQAEAPSGPVDAPKAKPPKKGKQKKKAGRKKSGSLRQSLQTAYREFTDTGNRSAVGRLWQELCFLLRHCRPKNLKADVTFSLSDPALTGEVLGVFSMFPFVYRHPCMIVPDFESETVYIKGMVFVKGKVRFGVFLLSLLRLYRDKNFRNIVRRLTGR